MNKNKKEKAMATVAGMVVGAGAVIASAVAMSDKKNQKKVDEVMSKTKAVVDRYSEQIEDKVEFGKKNLRKFTNTAIKTVEKATKVAKKGARKI